MYNQKVNLITLAKDLIRIGALNLVSSSSNLLKIAKHFPLWTGVMSACTASSACSEEYFRELKQLVFKGVKCMRIDKFLVMHIRSLVEAMKILYAADLHATSNDINDNTENTGSNNISNIICDIANNSNDSNIIDDPMINTRNFLDHDTTTVHANIPPALTNSDTENDNIIEDSADVNLTSHLNEIEN